MRTEWWKLDTKWQSVTKTGKYCPCYTPITVMSHPPRLVVGEDSEGSLTPAACPLQGHLPYMEEFYRTFTHMCSIDLMKETAPVEGN